MGAIDGCGTAATPMFVRDMPLRTALSCPAGVPILGDAAPVRVEVRPTGATGIGPSPRTVPDPIASPEDAIVLDPNVPRFAAPIPPFPRTMDVCPVGREAGFAPLGRVTPRRMLVFEVERAAEFSPVPGTDPLPLV